MASKKLLDLLKESESELEVDEYSGVIDAIKSIKAEPVDLSSIAASLAKIASLLEIAVAEEVAPEPVKRVYFERDQDGRIKEDSIVIKEQDKPVWQ